MAKFAVYVPSDAQFLDLVVRNAEPIIQTIERAPPPPPCQQCQVPTIRRGFIHRKIRDYGDVQQMRPIEIHLQTARYYCTRCKKYVHPDTTDIAPPCSRYTHRVVHHAIRLVVEDNLPYRTASWNLWRDHAVFVPHATIQNWVEAAGKKSRGPRPTTRVSG